MRIEKSEVRSQKFGPLRRFRPLPPATESALVDQYLHLVRSVCSNLAINLPAHVDRDDLYSNGLLGLIYALRKFKPDPNATLETYARIRIRGAVLDGLRALDWVPRLIHEKARKVHRIVLELEREHGRAPSAAEIAKALDIPLATYEQWEQEIKPPQFYSLDAPPRDPEADPSHYETQQEITDHNQQTPSDIAQRNETRVLLIARLNRLPDKQKHVLWLFYFKGMRLWEIAALCSLTEPRVSQIQHEGLRTLGLRYGVRRNPACSHVRKNVGWLSQNARGQKSEVRGQLRESALISDLRPLTSSASASSASSAP